MNFIPGSVSDLALDGNTLFVGGRFDAIGGVPRTHLAAVEATTGALAPWAPSVGGVGVLTVAAGAGKVAIAGGFGSVGGITKRGLVALDLATGRPSAVQPPDSNNITALAASGDLVVAATTQYPVNMIPEVFAYSAATGTRYPIALQVNGSVISLAISGRTLFMAGLFNTIAGQPRRNLAAYDLLSGALRSWNPSPDDIVRRIKVHEGALYAVGQFTSLTGYGRNGAASFDLSSLEVTSWDPRVEGLAISDLDAWQDRIFLGIFVRSTPLGAAVVRTVAVDSRSGAPLNVDLPLGTDLAQVSGTLAVVDRRQQRLWPIGRGHVRRTHRPAAAVAADTLHQRLLGQRRTPHRRGWPSGRRGHRDAEERLGPAAWRCSSRASCCRARRGRFK